MTDKSYKDLYFDYVEKMNDKIDTALHTIFKWIYLYWKNILSAWVFGLLLLLIATCFDETWGMRILGAAIIGYFSFRTPQKIRKIIRGD